MAGAALLDQEVGLEVGQQVLSVLPRARVPSELEEVMHGGFICCLFDCCAQFWSLDKAIVQLCMCIQTSWQIKFRSPIARTINTQKFFSAELPLNIVNLLTPRIIFLTSCSSSTDPPCRASSVVSSAWSFAIARRNAAIDD